MKDSIKNGSTMMFNMVEDHDRPAFEAWIAVYRNGGDHVIIAAPSLEALERAWVKLAILPLEEHRAQHCLVVKAPTTSK